MKTVTLVLWKMVYSAEVFEPGQRSGGPSRVEGLQAFVATEYKNTQHAVEALNASHKTGRVLDVSEIKFRGFVEVPVKIG